MNKQLGFLLSKKKQHAPGKYFANYSNEKKNLFHSHGRVGTVTLLSDTK